MSVVGFGVEIGRGLMWIAPNDTAAQNTVDENVRNLNPTLSLNLKPAHTVDDNVSEVLILPLMITLARFLSYR